MQISTPPLSCPLQVFRSDVPSPLLHTLPNQQMLLARTVSPDTPSVSGPRPLPLALRAMAYTAAYTAARVEPLSAKARSNLKAACVSYQQLRLLVGYGRERRSYVVGVAAPGAQWPQAARVRAATCGLGESCDESSLAKPGANAALAVGALVNGPALDGGYKDVRTDIDSSGTGVLNTSPLVLLAAAHLKMGLQAHDCLGMGEGVAE